MSKRPIVKRTGAKRASKPKETKAPTKVVAETRGEPRAFAITDVVHKGIEMDILDYAKRDSENKGRLRGGSSGAIVGGVQYGCARLAALRYHGVSLPSDLDGQYMMKFGIGYEYFIDYFLKKANVPANRVLREEEIPVDYPLFVDNDGPENVKQERVTGRPDIVILSKEGKPYWGLELKLKQTYYGAKNILLNSKVDTDHAIQALHYMFAHGLTRYSILYGIPVRFAVQSADEAAFIATNTAICRESDGKPQYAKQGVYETIFEWDESTDRLVSYTVHSGIEREIPIRMEHIQEFYKLVSRVASRQELGDRPSSKSLAAPGQKEWDKCTYCALKDVCNQYEDGPIDTWWDFAVAKAREEWQEKWPQLNIDKMF